jgi:L-fuconolactonase
MKIDTHQHYWRYQPQDFGWINDTMPMSPWNAAVPALAHPLTHARLPNAAKRAVSSKSAGSDRPPLR